jgi:hypothetical protein
MLAGLSGRLSSKGYIAEDGFVIGDLFIYFFFVVKGPAAGAKKAPQP